MTHWFRAPGSARSAQERVVKGRNILEEHERTVEEIYRNLPLIALYEPSILHELAQPNQFFEELVL
jgi:hypothetical protein